LVDCGVQGKGTPGLATKSASSWGRRSAPFRTQHDPTIRPRALSQYLPISTSFFALSLGRRRAALALSQTQRQRDIPSDKPNDTWSRRKHPLRLRLLLRSAEDQSMVCDMAPRSDDRCANSIRTACATCRARKVTLHSSMRNSVGFLVSRIRQSKLYENTSALSWWSNYRRCGLRIPGNPRKQGPQS
jgi:hypothetical protein